MNTRLKKKVREYMADFERRASYSSDWAGKHYSEEERIAYWLIVALYSELVDKKPKK